VETLSTFEEILSEVTSSKPNPVKKIVRALADNLHRAILLHLSEEGEIGYRQLPMKKFEQSTIATLSALDELESLEMVKSEMKEDGNRLHQVYSITEDGQKTIENLINNK